MAPNGNIIERNALAQAAGKDHMEGREIRARGTMKPRYISVGVMVVGLAIVFIGFAIGNFALPYIGGLTVVFGGLLAWYLETMSRQKKAV